MLDATGGVNTHRGAIFALGLICAAAGATLAEGQPLTSEKLALRVGTCWGPATVRGPIQLGSHGGRALSLFGAGGARAEVAGGFAQIRSIGLPALQVGRFLAGEEAARVHAFFALVATLEDTNLLHRGGAAGLHDARCAAQGFFDAGGAGRDGWLDHALTVHQQFMARRLSPGGSADMLAATLLLDRLERAS